MTDQCMHCTVRGDIDACMKTPCSQHESWYAQTLKALAKQEQGEPVCDKDPQGCYSVRCHLGNKCKNTPQQRKPLTDEQILRLLSKIDECAVRLPRGLREFARAIEAAHGIKE